MKRYGFTLFEMLIVILIVGLLLGLGSNMGRNRLQTIKEQEQIDVFYREYVNQIRSLLMSQQKDGRIYDYATISVASGSSQRNVSYAVGEDIYTDTFTYPGFSFYLSGNQSSILHQPGSLSCNTTGDIQFIIQGEASKRSWCFLVQNFTCALHVCSK